MAFSLDSLKPKVTDVKINAYGDEITIPIVPLTYTEYQNVGLDVAPPNPDDYKVRKLVNGKHEDIVDKSNPEYIKAWSDYTSELQLRRLAIALARGGTEELQGKSLAEQVELVREMDAGIASALIKYIESEARHRIASRFHTVSEDDS